MKLSHAQNVKEQCELLLRSDHNEHENIIHFLQDVADPVAISYLKQAVYLKSQLSYLDYDDYGAYYKKIFWALQAIGTKEAIGTITEFTQAENAQIKNEAIYRLTKIKQSVNCT